MSLQRFSDHRLLYVFLGVVFFVAALIVPRSAYADDKPCVRVVDHDRVIGDEHFTAVIFGSCPGVDLYHAARMFPQVDPDTGKPLPVQVQLRSIYAANGEVDLGGDKYRTVLRKCIPNSDPWPDQTPEEKELCPNKVNYFQNGFGGEVLIPHSRKKTLNEKMADALALACDKLKSRSGADNQDALEKCEEMVPGFVAGVANAKKPSPVELPSDASGITGVTNSALVSQVNALNAKVAVLAPLANRAKNLFYGLIALCIYGAGVTIVGLVFYRKKSRLAEQHRQYVLGHRNGRKDNFAATKEALRQEMHNALEAEKQRLEEQNKATLLEREKALQKDLDEKWSGISQELASRVQKLENENAGLQKEVDSYAYDLAEANQAGEQRNSQVAQLVNDSAGLQQRIDELASENRVLVQRNAELEDAAKRLGTVEQETSRLENQVADLERALAESAVRERSLKDGLERLAGSGDLNKKQTLPQSFGKADQSAVVAEDGKVPSRAAENGLEEAGSQYSLVYPGDEQQIPPGERGVQIFDLARDPDEPREEMATLADDAGLAQEKIAAEQIIFLRSEWKRLAKYLALKLELDMDIRDTSDTKLVFGRLSEACDKRFTAHVQTFRRLSEAENALDIHQKARAEAEAKVVELENALSVKTLEQGSANESAEALRSENEGLRKIINGDKLMEQLYAYQLSAAEANQRALRAEKARQSENALHAEAMQKALVLDEMDRASAQKLLMDLPQEELLRLTNVVFRVVAERLSRGDNLELPIGEMADLHALHDVANLRLIDDYGFTMPPVMKNIAGYKQPRLYHAMHDVFSGSENETRPEAEPRNSYTLMPPAGVPGDGNSLAPSEQGSGMRSKAAVCPPASSEDDGSRSAS